MDYHKPVLLNEVLAHLKIEKGKKYIDCTLGDGGHTLEILKRGGVVLGLDVSEESLRRAKGRIEREGFNDQFTGLIGNFKDLEDLAKKADFTQVSGILYDLGYSSFQMDESEVGLSFMRDLPLDMRLDTSLGVKASDLINVLSEKQLADLIFSLSDEKLAKRFAKAIVNARSRKRIQTTKELADLLVSEAPRGYEHGRIHPATRTFQALRIAVNSELENLKVSLPRAARLLLPGGVLCVISFHSLEDRLVKQFGRGAQPRLIEVTTKPVEPTTSEVADNNRARSAKLRVFEKAK